MLRTGIVEFYPSVYNFTLALLLMLVTNITSAYTYCITSSSSSNVPKLGPRQFLAICAKTFNAMEFWRFSSGPTIGPNGLWPFALRPTFTVSSDSSVQILRSSRGATVQELWTIWRPYDGPCHMDHTHGNHISEIDLSSG